MKIKYVILGSNGFVASKIYTELSKQNKDVMNFSWHSIKNNNLRNLLFDQKSRNKSSNNILQEKYIFLDCLIGSNCISSEIELHSRLIDESQLIQKNSIFFYFSTFEPHLSAQTSYRKMKYELEKFIIYRNSKIIRIGQLMQSKNKLNSQYNLYLSDLNKNPILIPCTYIEDLVEALIKNKFKKSINKCYSFYSKMYLNLSRKHFLIFSETDDSKFFIPVPIYLLAVLTFLLSLILNIIPKFKNKGYFQKFYSVYEHQRIIYKTSKS